MSYLRQIGTSGAQTVFVVTGASPLSGDPSITENPSLFEVITGNPPAGSTGLNYVSNATKVANYTMTKDDTTIDCNGTFTVTLPVVSTLSEHQQLTVKNSGSGNITVNTQGGDTVDGITSFIIYGGLDPKMSITMEAKNGKLIII